MFWVYTGTLTEVSYYRVYLYTGFQTSDLNYYKTDLVFKPAIKNMKNSRGGPLFI